MLRKKNPPATESENDLTPFCASPLKKTATKEIEGPPTDAGKQVQLRKPTQSCVEGFSANRSRRRPIHQRPSPDVAAA